jgi:hypothetical protein
LDFINLAWRGGLLAFCISVYYDGPDFTRHNVAN